MQLILHNFIMLSRCSETCLFFTNMVTANNFFIMSNFGHCQLHVLVCISMVLDCKVALYTFVCSLAGIGLQSCFVHFLVCISMALAYKVALHTFQCALAWHWLAKLLCTLFGVHQHGIGLQSCFAYTPLLTNKPEVSQHQYQVQIQHAQGEANCPDQIFVFGQLIDIEYQKQP